MSTEYFSYLVAGILLTEEESDIVDDDHMDLTKHMGGTDSDRFFVVGPLEESHKFSEYYSWTPDVMEIGSIPEISEKYCEHIRQYCEYWGIEYRAPQWILCVASF